MNEINLKGKKILFFSPAFFGYENKIKDKMTELGAIVDMFDERSVSKSWQKALLKVNPNIFNRRTEKYYFDILKKVSKKEYDYILFIKCDMPTKKVLIRYKEVFQNAKLCLHMWDSIKNIPNVQEKFQYFDHITSFDRYDCLNNERIKFRPLFYCDEYRKEIKTDQKYEYDLCFIGTIHSDRYKVLKEIEQKAQKMQKRLYIYPYIQSKFAYCFYKLVKKEFRKTRGSDFKFEKMTSKDIAQIVEQSKAIIDIQHPRQTGLTMRTIEMLGMNKKIITTNEDIANYDFYNPKNIQIISRSLWDINLEELSGDFKALDEEIYEKYSIEEFIKDVLL